jgi:hypothetical protein
MECYVAPSVGLHQGRAEEFGRYPEVGGGVAATGGVDGRVLEEEEGVRAFAYGSTES